MSSFSQRSRSRRGISSPPSRNADPAASAGMREEVEQRGLPGRHVALVAGAVLQRGVQRLEQ